MNWTICTLPATDPSDSTFGSAPVSCTPAWPVHNVQFDRLVWYNHDICRQSWLQLQPVTNDPPCALVGFSKSGLGAIRLACEHPGAFQACVVFDSPVAREIVPPWQTEAFYCQQSWAEDLPMARLPEIVAMSQECPLILLSGESFAEEMQLFANELGARGARYQFYDKKYAHHWDSGWFEEVMHLLQTEVAE